VVGSNESDQARDDHGVLELLFNRKGTEAKERSRGFKLASAYDRTLQAHRLVLQARHRLCHHGFHGLRDKHIASDGSIDNLSNNEAVGEAYYNTILPSVELIPVLLHHLHARLDDVPKRRPWRLPSKPSEE
jgi:hypothetical protein